MPNKPSMLMPALIAGGASGLLSGLPVISCCCCLYVIGGGVLAAYLYSESCKKANFEFAPSNGAVIGILMGLVHAAVATVIGTIANMAMGAMGMAGEQDLSQMFDEMQADIPPEVVQMLENMSSGEFTFVGFLIALIVNLLIGCTGGLIGGLIGGLDLEVRRTSAASAACDGRLMGLAQLG